MWRSDGFSVTSVHFPTNQDHCRRVMLSFYVMHGTCVDARKEATFLRVVTGQTAGALARTGNEREVAHA